MDVWAYQYRVQLDFIRPGKRVENSYGCGASQNLQEDHQP